MSKDANLEQYFAEASAWEADRVALRERSTRIAWRIATVAVLLLALTVLTLIMLMPLKRVEPFVIRVDNTTGIVDVVPVAAGTASVEETVTRYFLSHYVTVCERFNFSTAESDYQECSAFHAAARNQEWATFWDRSNPSSPLNAFKDGSAVRAQVTAISFFRRANGVQDTAQIRYTKARRRGGTGNDEISHWIATVQYAYGKPSTRPEIRQKNPLGFRVLDFRPEPEVLAPDAVGTRAAQPSGAGAAR